MRRRFHLKKIQFFHIFRQILNEIQVLLQPTTLLILLLFFFMYHLQNFREQCIDGSGLPLLTEDHLMHSLNMKLGPALKLRSVLLKRLGGPCPCVSCNSLTGNANNCTATVSTVPSPLNRPSSTGSGT